MREFGAVGERELDGCACVEVEAGIGFAAPEAHRGDNCVLIDGEECVGLAFVAFAEHLRDCGFRSGMLSIAEGIAFI